MKIAVIAICTVMLSGCVSEKATLTNANGQQVHCDHFGMGWLGAPIAMGMHHDCMKKAHKAGYSEMPMAQQPAK